MKNVKNYSITHTNGNINGEIILSRDFANRANIINSAEYTALVQFRKDFPEYAIRIRESKKPARKETHRGLTIDRMDKYIAWRGNVADVRAFANVKEYFKGDKGYYAKVKKWFLDNHEDYKDFDPAMYDPNAPALDNESGEDTPLDTRTAPALMVNNTNPANAA